MDAQEILTSLDYTINNGTIKELEIIKEKTPGFDKLIKHVIDLHNHLKIHNAYVAMSSTNPYLKIKNVATEKTELAHIDELIHHWAEKYKAKLQKVHNAETYYIIGFKPALA